VLLPRSGSAVDWEWTAPIPEQQRGQVGHLVIGDSGEHVGEPGLGIDVVGLAVWISVSMTAARSPPRSDAGPARDIAPLLW
jgi:hypothetical protein